MNDIASSRSSRSSVGDRRHRRAGQLPEIKRYLKIRKM